MNHFPKVKLNSFADCDFCLFLVLEEGCLFVCLRKHYPAIAMSFWNPSSKEAEVGLSSSQLRSHEE